MTLAEPWRLALLLVVPLLALAMWRGDREVRRRLARLVAPRLRSRLVQSTSPVRHTVRRALLLAALGAFALACARPQWGSTERPTVRHGRDIFFAIDTSRSMLTADVSPNRLTRAKLVVEDIVRSSSSDRFGLIAFAGDAQVEAPLTADDATLRSTLAGLDTNTVERGGTDVEGAIRAAMQAFGRSEQGYRALVLVTDGESLEGDPVVAAEAAAKLGIRIFTVGVGSVEGGPVTLASGLPLRDRQGNPVISRLDEGSLRAVAEATGGFYTRLEVGTAARLLREGLSRITERRANERALRIPTERFQWPLAAGLVLLAGPAPASHRPPPPGGGPPPGTLSTTPPTRRAVPAAMAPAIALTLAAAVALHAATPLELYRQGDYEHAWDRFREELQRRPDDPLLNYNAGDAGYRLGKYDQAFEGYAKAMNSPDLTLRQHAYFNAGNALFKQGDAQQDLEGRLTKYDDARYQYEQALEIDGTDEAARRNLELLKRRIKETEEQKRQQSANSPKGRPSRSRHKGQGDPSQDKRAGDAKQPKRGEDPSGENGPEDNDTPPAGEGDGPQDDSSPDTPDAEATPTEKKEGDLRERPGAEDGRTPEEAQPETAPGRMSAEEARGLLDSLRGDEDHVNLNHHRRDRPVAKDW